MNKTASRTKWGEIIAAGEYRYYGVRVLDEQVSVGDEVAPSRVWVDNDQTDEVLPGACALWVESADDLDDVLAVAARYVGEHTVLLGSDEWLLGEDDGEIVMADAVVVAL